MDQAFLADERMEVISREDARLLGRLYYYLGDPCKRGHRALRYVSNKKCLRCIEISKKKSRGKGQRCSVIGCDEKHNAKGYCTMHYARWKEHGNPLIVQKTPAGFGMEWLKSHIDFQEDGCLTWPFGLGAQGYGSVKYQGRSMGAHLVMCMLAHGEKPGNGYVAAHNCGKGHEACVNPRHLRWDTISGNHADMFIHGTHNRGERCSTHKLKESDVRQIRTMIGKIPMKEIGQMFGVSYSLIFSIKHRVSWGWLE